MPKPLVVVLRYWLVWAAVSGVFVAIGPRKLAGQPAVTDPPPATGLPDTGAYTEAIGDTTAAVPDTFLAWRPAGADTVWTALAKTVPTLGEAFANTERLAAAGAVAFARVRANYTRYWYEIVLGPWPDAAALDSALLMHPPDHTAQSRSEVPTLWDSTGRGTVAVSWQRASTPLQLPHSADADSNTDR